MVQKLTILKALAPFLIKPKEKIHLMEISNHINESYTTVRLWLRFLEKKGIVKKEYKGRMTFFSLNFENALIIDYLVVDRKSVV